MERCEPRPGRANGLLDQSLRYGLVGMANTVIGLGVILALQAAGLSPYSANAGGYAAGLACSFLLNRAWTFDVCDRPAQRFLRFLVAFAPSYALNLVVLAILIVPLGHAVAQALAMVAYSGLFFALCRSVVFTSGTAPIGEQERRWREVPDD